MVIEHEFVTTLEPQDALRQAAEYLSARGFGLVAEPAAFSMDQQWTTLEMQRGKKSAARARSISQLPQRVRLEWDRGKMSLALSIGANSAWGGGTSFSLSNNSAGNPKKMRLHVQLLNAIARGLETLLSCAGPRQAQYTEWDIAEEEIRKAARRRTIKMVTILVVILLCFAGIIALAVMNS